MTEPDGTAPPATGGVVALDAGGTFLDVVARNQGGDRVAIRKVPRTGNGQAAEIRAALRDVLVEIGEPCAATVLVGTTVVTNALLEGALAPTALVTTDGFQDVLAMGRMLRPSSYDLKRHRPPPPVPEHLRFGVRERIDHEGNELVALDERGLEDLVAAIAGSGARAVAVCLLHSVRDPGHERAVGGWIEQRTSLPVSLSCDVVPVLGEYERMGTTAINAAAIDTMCRFLDDLGDGLADLAGPVLVMGSAGGAITAAQARRRPAATVFSGPAGGVLAAIALAKRHGFGSVLACDVGGTSTDLAFIEDAEVPLDSSRTVAGHAIALPSLDIHTVGAGGGSLACVDATGLLTVGPQSAGASPGPVCYGRGGVGVTLTDCFVALGLLGSDSMLGGDFVVDAELALRAIEEQLAAPLGVSWQQAAHGVLDIAADRMAAAARHISIQRGRDPRRASLVAFGGAGAMHAVALARRLGMHDVIVPPSPGVFSAGGILDADVEFAVSGVTDVTLDPGRDDPRCEEELRAALAALADAAQRQADAELAPGSPPRTVCRLDLRYVGQGRPLTVTVSGERLRADEVLTQFHREHDRRHGYAEPTTPVECLAAHVVLKWPAHRSQPAPEPSWAEGQAAYQHRKVWRSDGTCVEYPVYHRPALRPGATITGPAIIEQYDTTTIVDAAFPVTVLADLSLHIAVSRTP